LSNFPYLSILSFNWKGVQDKVDLDDGGNTVNDDEGDNEVVVDGDKDGVLEFVIDGNEDG